MKRNFENILAAHDITEYDVQCSEAETLVDRVSVEVRKAVDAIEKQDYGRKLWLHL